MLRRTLPQMMRENLQHVLDQSRLRACVAFDDLNALTDFFFCGVSGLEDFRPS